MNAEFQGNVLCMVIRLYHISLIRERKSLAHRKMIGIISIPTSVRIFFWGERVDQGTADDISTIKPDHG
jgi:hypothetical protein